MKILPTLLLILLTIVAHAQNNSAVVSMNGIGDFKLGMKVTEVEKLLNKKISLPNLSKEDYTRDTIHTQYNGMNVELVFEKEYVDENKWQIVVWEVKSSHPNLKTKSGIGIGDDKIKIINTYPDYTIHLMPDYENDYQTKSKTKSTVWLFGDESGKLIIFYLFNGKVTGFSVTYNEGC